MNDRILTEAPDKGAWSVQCWEDGRVVLQSDDFTHDVALIITGDFSDNKLDYATRLAEWMNYNLTKKRIEMKDKNISECSTITNGVDKHIAINWSKNEWLCIEDDNFLPKTDWYEVETCKVVERIIPTVDKSPDKHIEAIRELLKTRSEIGLKKYGVTLERKDLKPSEWAQHLLEELLDAAGYIHRLKEDLEDIERFGK